MPVIVSADDAQQPQDAEQEGGAVEPDGQQQAGHPDQTVWGRRSTSSASNRAPTDRRRQSARTAIQVISRVASYQSSQVMNPTARSPAHATIPGLSLTSSCSTPTGFASTHFT
jgi:hypothetical protein